MTEVNWFVKYPVFVIHFDREEFIMPVDVVEYNRNYPDIVREQRPDEPCSLSIDGKPYCPGECPQMVTIHKDNREVTIFVYGEPRLLELPEPVGAFYGRALHDDIMKALKK